MTVERIVNILAENNIPLDVKMMSNSGWECDATDMDGVWYNSQKNLLVFTQIGEEFDYEAKDSDFRLIHSSKYTEGNIHECMKKAYEDNYLFSGKT